MNQLVVSLIVILLPGIVAAVISDKLTSHSKWDSFKFGLYSLMLGISTYTLLQVLVYVWNFLSSIRLEKIAWTHLEIWQNALATGPGHLSAWEICCASVLSIPVAFISSAIINYKVFNRIAQKLKFTYKYGDENLYSYYLSTKEIVWVTIRDKEKNLTYEGRVMFHSENDKIQELVLADVSVYRYEDSAFLYSVPTIYLSREAGKFAIEAISEERFGGKDE